MVTNIVLAQQIRVYYLRAYINLIFTKPSGDDFYSVNKPQYIETVCTFLWSIWRFRGPLMELPTQNCRVVHFKKTEMRTI